MALFIELLLMGVGLAMDAFAVSVCKGSGMKKLNKKQALVIGLYFGGFQALMPLVDGFSDSVPKYITSIDHWIAFILLGFIGGKMILEAVKEWNEEDIVEVKISRWIIEICLYLPLRRVSMRWQSESHLHFWTHRFLRQLRSSELRQ